MTWTIEPIPCGDTLYMRVHWKIAKDDAQIPAGVFKDRDNAGMSTDWCKYSSAAQTRSRGEQDPDQYAVIALVVEEVTKISPLRVKHSPIEPNPLNEHVKLRPGNQAHADILDLNLAGKIAKTEARAKLWDASRKVIHEDDPI